MLLFKAFDSNKFDTFVNQNQNSKNCLKPKKLGLNLSYCFLAP